jgi:hypothetical protein
MMSFRYILCIHLTIGLLSHHKYLNRGKTSRAAKLRDTPHKLYSVASPYQTSPSGPNTEAHMSSQTIAQLVRSRNRLLMALLLLLLLVLCGAAYFAQRYANATLQNIFQGTIGSIVASIVFYLLFQRLVEPNIVEAAMLAATEASTRLTLDHLQQVPTAVYAGGETSDLSFEAHLKALLRSSGPQGSYTFLGESALTASKRLQDPNWKTLLSSLQNVTFIVTDPMNATALEIQARHRLERRQGNYDQAEVLQECNTIKFSVYQTIEAILPLLITSRYDLTFLNGHVLSRRVTYRRCFSCLLRQHQNIYTDIILPKHIQYI